MVSIEKDRIRTAIQELKQCYEGLQFEPRVWKRDGNKRDPYRVLIVMGFSLRTRDKVVVSFCKEFFSIYPTANDLINAWHESRDDVLSKVEQLGNTKSRRQILEAAVKFGNEIPSEVTKLQQRRGIKETTAEKVVGYGYGKAALPLDSHGCRIVDRICSLNLSKPSQYHQRLRNELKNIFSPSEWMEVHELLRLHGMVVCEKKQPVCGDCPLSVCAFRRENPKRIPCDLKAAAGQVIDKWDEWRRLLIRE